MRTGILLSGLAAALIALVGCGSSKSSSSKSTNTAARVDHRVYEHCDDSYEGEDQESPSRTYAVKLTGAAETPAGPSSGSGKAVATLSTKTQQGVLDVQVVERVQQPDLRTHPRRRGRNLGQHRGAAVDWRHVQVQGLRVGTPLDDQRDCGQPARLLREHSQQAISERCGPCPALGWPGQSARSCRPAWELAYGSSRRGDLSAVPVWKLAP